jgi:hypothetical protein
MPIEIVNYAGWDRCLRLSNDLVEAVVTTEVGPRILRFGAAGGPNMLHEAGAQQGLRGGSEWHAFGGHRLWHAPEAKPRTYVPDNAPVQFEIEGQRVRLTQPVEAGTGIQKQMELQLDSTQAHLRLVHRLTNRGAWPVELAPWAITIMAPGGVAVVPQEPFAPHPDFQTSSEATAGEPSYLPARSLALWSYTRLSDPRWMFRDRFILLRQDPGMAAPLKFGVSNRQGWCAYARGSELFLKRFGWQEGAVYPDRGCNNEVFTNGEMLEVESLGPMTTLAPGEFVEHAEDWFHVRDISWSTEDEALHTVFQDMPGTVAGR